MVEAGAVIKDLVKEEAESAIKGLEKEEVVNVPVDQVAVVIVVAAETKAVSVVHTKNVMAKREEEVFNQIQ
jgi:hypothetical protein